MTWFTGIVVFLLVWWVALFCVLPIGTRPDADGDPAAGGWRGTPVAVHLGWKLLGTTALSAVIWGGIWLLIEADWISFRSGPFALPAN
jgi:predicted secreted protein